MSDDVFNYVPYFSEIEDTFIRRRGKSMFVGPLDWALIASWEERGIPLHVVLRSIEEVFDNRQSRAQTGRISSLRYCQDEVEKQFRQYREMMVGSHEPTGDGSDQHNPFSKENVIAHLDRLQRTLANLPINKWAGVQKAERDLWTARDQFESSQDVRSLEGALTAIDDDLALMLSVAATPDQVMECRAKVESAMAGYARSMTEDAYRQTFSSLLAKGLRELFSIPRLSLFHMKG